MQKGWFVFWREVALYTFPVLSLRILKRKDVSLMQLFPCFISTILRWTGVYLWVCSSEKVKHSLVPRFKFVQSDHPVHPSAHSCFQWEHVPRFIRQSALLQGLLWWWVSADTRRIQAKLQILPYLSNCKAKVQFHIWLDDSVFMFAADFDAKGYCIVGNRQCCDFFCWLILQQACSNVSGRRLYWPLSYRFPSPGNEMW